MYYDATAAYANGSINDWTDTAWKNKLIISNMVGKRYKIGPTKPTNVYLGNK